MQSENLFYPNFRIYELTSFKYYRFILFLSKLFLENQYFDASLDNFAVIYMNGDVQRPNKDKWAKNFRNGPENPLEPLDAFK